MSATLPARARTQSGPRRLQQGPQQRPRIIPMEPPAYIRDSTPVVECCRCGHACYAYPDHLTDAAGRFVCAFCAEGFADEAASASSDVTTRRDGIDHEDAYAAAPPAMATCHRCGGSLPEAEAKPLLNQRTGEQHLFCPECHAYFMEKWAARSNKTSGGHRNA